MYVNKNLDKRRAKAPRATKSVVDMLKELTINENIDLAWSAASWRGLFGGTTVNRHCHYFKRRCIDI